jgi:hypothetical protein
VVTAAINLRTSRVAVALQKTVTSVKCLALLSVCTLAFLAQGSELAALARPVPGRFESLSGIGVATLAALWASLESFKHRSGFCGPTTGGTPSAWSPAKWSIPYATCPGR